MPSGRPRWSANGHLAGAPPEQAKPPPGVVAVLGHFGAELLVVDVLEDRDTFYENALKKATETAAVAGVPCLADDSGLEVDALDGRPGVYSARYAGEGASDAQNNAKLLAELSGVSDERRAARFRCVIVIVDAEGRELAMAEGTCEGRIGQEPRGGHGFGYDPVFIPDGYDEAMAELGPETKNEISHRAMAAAKLVPLLRELQNP